MYGDIVQWLETHLLSCPVKSYIGVDCPGCGLQRSIIYLLKGDVEMSLRMHPAGIPLVFLLLFLVAHLKFKFSFGPKLLVAIYSLIAAVLLVHYACKWIYGMDYLLVNHSH